MVRNCTARARRSATARSSMAARGAAGITICCDVRLSVLAVRTAASRIRTTANPLRACRSIYSIPRVSAGQPPCAHRPRSWVDRERCDPASRVPFEMQTIGPRRPELEFVNPDCCQRNPPPHRQVEAILPGHANLETGASAPDFGDNAGRKLITPDIDIDHCRGESDLG